MPSRTTEYPALAIRTPAAAAARMTARFWASAAPSQGAHLARGSSLEPGYVVPAVITTTASSDFRSTLRRFPGTLVIDVVAAGHRRLATCGLVLAGVETDLSSSEDNRLASPSPLRRRFLDTRSKIPGVVRGLRP
jgi:hypothetical protein